MVRIGNDPDARPQVGINEADLVYEEIVEWWVTRFTAIYLGQDPEEIRPIRSARLINLQLTPQYGGALAYAGGSDPVRWELSQIDIVNLDDYFVPQPFFFLPNETWERRQALNAAEARKYLRDNGLERDVGLRGFFFDPDVDWNSLPREAVGEAGEIFIPYPAAESELTWQYDPASGQYLRFTLDGPMRDAAGKQLSADNVILYFAEHESTGIVEDSTGATSVRVFVNGFGTAWVAREGKILKGNWQTDGSQTPQFIFNNFQPIPLRPGRSWIEVVPLGYLITIDGVEHARLSDPAGKPEATPTTPASTESRPTQTAPTSTPGKRDLQ
jgi:hypothetical protein